MSRTRKLLYALPALPVAVLGVLLAQILKTAHRPDLPSFPNQDPSGDFGDSNATRLRIVALGDSSITAPGVADIDDTWIRRISHRLSEEYFVELRSVAVGGSKARDVIRTQLEAAIALKPDVAVIAIGANDAIRATPMTQFADELRVILRSLAAEAEAVVIMGVGDMGTVPRLPGLLRSFASRRSRIVDETITLIVAEVPKVFRPPMWGRVSEQFRHGDLSLFAGDHFHASGAGHGVFAAGIMPTMERAVRRVGIARQRTGDQPG